MNRNLKHRRLQPLAHRAFGVAGEFPALQQARAHNVPANAKQACGFKLIAVTIFSPRSKCYLSNHVAFPLLPMQHLTCLPGRIYL